MQNLPTDAKTLLLKAAEYIADNGWARFRMRTSSGKVCLRGALDAVASADSEDAIRRDAERLLAMTLPSECRPTDVFEDAANVNTPDRDYSNNAGTIVFWNDQCCASEEQAIAQLLRAAGVV